MPLDDDFVEIAARVRNWGRWGDDDELGTLNLIDAAAVQRGAAYLKGRGPGDCGGSYQPGVPSA